MLDVLIIGGGTVGLAAGVFLAANGLRAVVLERNAGLSEHPRALGLGPRTLELMRPLGLAAEFEKRALQHGRGRMWLPVQQLAGTDFSSFPNPEAETSSLTPGRSLLCSQDVTDKILFEAAGRLGTEIAFSSRVLKLRQDAQTVVAQWVDATGHPRERKARFAVLAEGGVGALREGLGFTSSGPGDMGQPILNVLFEADLAPIGLRGDEFGFPVSSITSNS